MRRKTYSDNFLENLSEQEAIAIEKINENLYQIYEICKKSNIKHGLFIALGDDRGLYQGELNIIEFLRSQKYYFLDYE